MGNQGVVSTNQIKQRNRPSKKTKHFRRTRQQSLKSALDGLRSAIRKLKAQRYTLDRKLLDIDSRSDHDARMRRLALMSKLHRVSVKLENAELRFKLLLKQGD